MSAPAPGPTARAIRIIITGRTRAALNEPEETRP